MDIFKFFNSKSVASHLKSINYEFSPLESAYIVWQSKFTTVREKIEAWEEIIATTQDMEVKKRPWFEYQPSLHAYLRKCIDNTKKAIDQFYDSAGAVYSYELLFNGDSVWDNNNGKLFTSFDLCKADMLSEIEDEEVVCYYVKKRILNSGNYTTLLFDSNHEVCEISIIIDDKVDGCDMLHDADFEGLWFQIPTPFKKGDIVRFNDRWVNCGIEDGMPFVLLDMSSWGKKELIENGYIEKWELDESERLLNHRKENGDNTDMLASGYHIGKHGNVYWDHMVFGTYLNLEYCEDDLPPEKSFLSDISQYVKWNINADTLAANYKSIADKRVAELLKPDPYTPEQWKIPEVV
ncbi:MAG: hypothetical protein K2M36_00035 [Clostridia bacterium]|nr:hypothetical protein [Clostridia bacterium]